MKTNKFRKFSTGALVGVALCCLALTASAQLSLIPPSNGFSVSTTNADVNPSYAVVSARSANNGTPAVYSVNVNSDLASAVLKSYKCTADTVARYATNATVTLSVTQTNGFSSGDIIVIRHLLTDNYERRILTTMTASTNLIVTVAPLEAVVPGDLIYNMKTANAAFIKIGATTNSFNGGGGPLLVGQKGFPLLLEVTSTTLGALNAACGIYLP